jgi:oligopeptide/dipeptide ABC transporter ATP-binding protein
LNGQERNPSIDVRGLRKWFPVYKGFFGRHTGDVKAVDGVSFEVAAGETVCLVGESGSGKSTVARAMLRLVEPTAGEVWIRARGVSVDFLQLRLPTGAWRGPAYVGLFLLLHTAAARVLEFPGELAVNVLGGVLLLAWTCANAWEASDAAQRTRSLREQMQIVFQDHSESLNPRMSIGEILGEPLRVHLKLPPVEVEQRVVELLAQVGLPEDARARFPHEFSGGQRQRIGIARALALEPRWVVCDEALSALDVSVQAQILNLLADLQRELSLAYLFISHDLAVVRHIADRIHVMYLGRIVEEGLAADIFERAAHPYTQALLQAIPTTVLPGEGESVVETEKAEVSLGGEVPSALDPPSGCHYRPRCPFADPRCEVFYPAQVALSETHRAACHLLVPDEPAPARHSGS